MLGVINLNKPAGWTSREAVSSVKRLKKGLKAGHAGTLDPLASGVLPICLGAATRLVDYAHRLPKSYRATFLLGRSSASDDVEGEVAILVDPPKPSDADLRVALAAFTGWIEQRPPRHSAVKIAGRRAYKLARRGAEFETTSRRVRIDRLAVVRYEYPELVLEIDCGTGTYIRSLGRDLAESLGTAAVMAELERTAVGPLTMANSVTPYELDRDCDFASRLLPPSVFTGILPSIRLTPEECHLLRFGNPARLGDRPIEPPSVASLVDDEQAPAAPELAGIAPDGTLAAVLREIYPDLYFPVRNLSQPV